MKAIFILFIAYIGPDPDAVPDFMARKFDTVEECRAEAATILANFQAHASIGDMTAFCGFAHLNPLARAHS